MVGDMSPEQEKALADFTAMLKDKFDLPAGDDHEKLRFLRARDFDLDKSYEMYTTYLVGLFIHSLIHSFTHSFTHSFIHVARLVDRARDSFPRMRDSPSRVPAPR